MLRRIDLRGRVLGTIELRDLLPPQPGHVPAPPGLQPDVPRESSYATARELARAGHTVLLGARDPGRGRTAAGELTGHGADVRLVACDAADRDALAAVLAEHRPAVIVHAAGLLEHEAFGGQSRLERVERPWWGRRRRRGESRGRRDERRDACHADDRIA